LNKSSLSTNNSTFVIEERRRRVASLVAMSLTETQIANQLNVSQPTIHRDIEALKEMSQQFVYNLAKSDLSYYYKQSIDGLDEVRKQAWLIYASSDFNIQPKDRLTALRIVKDCFVDKFEMLNSGPSVMAMKAMSERLEKIESAKVSQ